MIRKINYADLFVSDLGWLQSRFHFSFAEYFNRQNMNFGVLRVMNDDIVQPQTGFGAHPHKDMEIFSYVLAGELSHGDSLGNQETLRRGDMQYMSAGTGVVHSEMNSSPNEAARFIQTWILPRQKNLPPNYGSRRFTRADRLNRWLHLLGDKDSGAAVCIHQDANAYVSELDDGQTLNYALQAGRQAYLKVLEGDIALGDLTLGHGDAAEIRDVNIALTANSAAHVMLIEMLADVAVEAAGD
jgi:redox-sensitive bicupin YhaK (pirin superfamily)